MEFETPEEVAGFTKYVAEKQVDFSKDLEQLTAVRTGDTSMMVYRFTLIKKVTIGTRLALKKYDSRTLKPTDRVRLQGDARTWFTTPPFERLSR